MSATQVRSYSALRNTMREFETTLIIRPDTNKDGIVTFVGRLREVFEQNGGRMQKIDNWGLRTLAYPINGNAKGIYLYVRYLGGSDTVKELERILRIREEIVRYLTVVIDGDIDPGARPSDVDAETLDAASEIAPDPLEVAAAKAAEEAAARAAEQEAEEAKAKQDEAGGASDDATSDDKASADKASAETTDKTETDKTEEEQG